MSVVSSIVTSTSRSDEEETLESNRLFRNSSLDAENDTDKNQRTSCKFGNKCYRQNPRHRQDMAHPGDADYRLPVLSLPNEDAPRCKYGEKCYRLNPEHFQNYKHPHNTNKQENYDRYCQQRRKNVKADRYDYDNSDEDDEDDPFAGDSDGSEYEPSEDEY